MNETQQHNAQHPVALVRPQRDTMVEWMISSATGLVSGLIAAGVAIRREFESEVSQWPGMTGEHGLTKKYQRLFDDCDTKYAGKPELWREHATEKATLKNNFLKEFEQDFLKGRYGIESEGFFKGTLYGTYQRSRHLGTSNKKLDVWFKGASVATIIGVGFYNLVTSIATRKKARQIEDLILDKATTTDQPAPEATASHRDHPTHHVTGVEHHHQRLAPEPAQHAQPSL